jgi:hypothetical protein
LRIVDPKVDAMLNNKPAHLLVTALLLMIPIAAEANMGIPGPLIIFGSYFFPDFGQWLIVNMVMCIAVEGAVFLFYKQYRRPFWASAYANIVSLFLGYPVLLLFFFAFSEGLIVILCTIGSIFIEYFALRIKYARRVFLAEENKFSITPVLMGNILTNLMMILNIYIVAPRAHV